MADSFGNTEVNDLRDRDAVVQCHHDIRRLEVTMNNALGVGMLDSLANQLEQ